MINTDTIERAASGDAGAFQRILAGCQDRVMDIAWRFAGDRDDAEDLAQEILLQVFRSLGSLRETERFWGWLSMLAQRVCLSRKRMEGRRRLILGDLQIEQEGEDPSVATDPFWSPDEALLDAERREGIRKALNRIGQQSRKALEMFYLDGLSLREIASDLDVSENTVKQRLHWGRNRLREEMMAMPETASERQRPASKRPLVFWLWGEHSGDARLGPLTLTRSLMAQQILLRTAKTPKTSAELAGEVGADRVYVEDHLSALEEGELVRREGEDRYAADFFILDKEAQEEIRACAQEIGRRDAEIVAGHLQAVREAFARCPFEAQGFGWDEMCWVAAVLLNLGVYRADPEVHAMLRPLRPDGCRWYFFGHTQDVPGGEWTLGCNTSSDGEGGVAEFWTPAIKGGGVYLPQPEERLVVYALSEGPRTAEEIGQETGVADARAAVSRLIEAGYVAKEADRLRLCVPVLTEEEDRILRPEVDRVAQEVVTRSRKPGLAETGLDGLLDRLGFSDLRSQYPCMHASMSSRISGWCLAGLVEMGHLEKPTGKPSKTWACWAWKGRVGLMQGAI